jgi:hypothetical protein
MGKTAWIFVGFAFFLGLLIATAGTLALLPGPLRAPMVPTLPALPVPPATAPAPPPPEPPAAALALPDIRTVSLADIEADRGKATEVFRLDVDPDILVIDYPDLPTQAKTLNRVAALIEKAGMPRDKVLSETELNARIVAEGGDVNRFYIGHDYRAGDLARFFAIADRQGMPLNAHEVWLRDTLRQLDWLKPGAVGSLITIPGIADDIDATARAAILHHELSHAVYFTDPAYVALTMHFWNDMLTADERTAIRRSGMIC